MLFKVFSFGISLLVMVFRGIALKYLWMWFIVPVFIGAPAIPLTTAIGISFMASLLTDRNWLKSQMDEIKSYSASESAYVSIINHLSNILIIASAIIMGYIFSR